MGAASAEIAEILPQRQPMKLLWLCTAHGPPADCADLPGGYADRDLLARELRLRFPTAAALDGCLSSIRGGRRAAERQLLALDPVRYGRSRNFLDGAVSGLSPYVRHGVLGLAELKRNLLTRLRHWDDGAKLISELAWRDFWQRVCQQRGDAIGLDLEPLKTGRDPSAYAAELPAGLSASATGLACIDAFSLQLLDSG
jgi:deoxyribodipyrimidine photo-lyase